jgi:FtsP/CotA-like multicopper oxidase with cupredoxin domain
MRGMKMTKTMSLARLFLAPMVALFLAVAAHAATPGIGSTSGTAGTFALTAQTAFLNQPDGSSVYSWGYGCVAGSVPTFLPAAIGTGQGANCTTMQVPGPTMIVTEGTTVTVTLTNNLPTAAGNTSILFPDFTLTSTCAAPAQQGLLACEAVPGGSVTYTFVASMPGTHAYYSGTQGDLQVEMGLYGALVVLPKTIPANCDGPLPTQNLAAKAHWGETDFRLAHAAYDHPKTCYDREYLFQWSEMDMGIHREALAQVTAKAGCAAGSVGCSLEVPTEPYHPAFFLINGRSMPDLMDANYAAEYPHQPYNGNPHMHPGEQVLIRTIGQGRWQHPFHEHANHVRILARDGNLVLSAGNTSSGGTVAAGTDLAGLLMFNTDTTPGEAFDGIFYFTGRGLNWDPYGHTVNSFSGDPNASLSCTPDAYGYNTGFASNDTTYTGTVNSAVASAINYYEWCQDHNKPLEANPFGDVTSGGPATLPNPNIFTNGPWYGGTPYLGPDASLRAGTTLRPVSQPTGSAGGTSYGGSAGCVTGTTIVTAPTGTNPTPNCTPLQPANVQANPPEERGWAYMWHSHNEREITTNNVFPGGMLMMMLVDSREFVIDESM